MIRNHRRQVVVPNGLPTAPDHLTALGEAARRGRRRRDQSLAALVSIGRHHSRARNLRQDWGVAGVAVGGDR